MELCCQHVVIEKLIGTPNIIVCNIQLKFIYFYFDIFRYIQQGLAKLVNNDPKTIRLNFPAKLKNKNDVFSILSRENICSVCGWSNHFCKKSIIPKEFIRHMPSMYRFIFVYLIFIINYNQYIWISVVNKSHISHDTLLLCYWCHIKSNESDLNIRKKLFDMCKINKFNPKEYQTVIHLINLLKNTFLFDNPV